jgi:hypothetical protein
MLAVEVRCPTISTCVSHLIGTWARRLCRSTPRSVDLIKFLHTFVFPVRDRFPPSAFGDVGYCRSWQITSYLLCCTVRIDVSVSAPGRLYLMVLSLCPYGIVRLGLNWLNRQRRQVLRRDGSSLVYHFPLLGHAAHSPRQGAVCSIPLLSISSRHQSLESLYPRRERLMGLFPFNIIRLRRPFPFPLRAS